MRRNLPLGAAGLLALFTFHCGSKPAPTAGPDPSVGSTAEPLTGTATSGATYNYCWADIERPLPTASLLAIGTQMTLRANPTLNCPPGVSNAVVYRFYVAGGPGTFSAEAPGTWSTSGQVAFNSASLISGDKYQIYLESLPSSLLSAWQAGDPTALAAVHRSSNTYTTFVEAHWAMSPWSACSLTCGGGTQTRTATCVDSTGAQQPGLCFEYPILSQACDAQACASDTLSVNGTSTALTPQTQSTPNMFYVWADPTSSGWSVDVEFASEPMSAQDYTAFDDSSTTTIPAGKATVWIWNATTTYWTTSSSPNIHVEQEQDGHLHVVYSDPALPDHKGGSIPVAFDLQL